MWQCDLCGTKSGKGFGKRVGSFILVCTCILLPSREHNEVTSICKRLSFYVVAKLSSSRVKSAEATFDVLARLIEIKFASGIIDELLYLDHPRENRFSNGMMMLEYRKAVQETVHEQFRVVREGHLRIIFSQDLKVSRFVFPYCDYLVNKAKTVFLYGSLGGCWGSIDEPSGFALSLMESGFCFETIRSNNNRKIVFCCTKKNCLRVSHS